MSTTYWGYHLMIDAAGCSIEAITSKENIEQFAKTLVERIDMKAYGEPQVPHFASHDPDKGGYTLVQLIETSAITGHFVDATGEAYLDIFSCKPFDESVAIEVAKEFFKPKDYNKTFLYRRAPAC